MTEPTKFSFKALGEMIAGIMESMMHQPPPASAYPDPPKLKPGLRVEFEDEFGRKHCGVIEQVFEEDVLVNDDIGTSILVLKSAISEDVLRGERAGERTPPHPRASKF